MSFTALQRAGYLGASDMRWVMNPSEPEQLLQWWEVKVGIREPEPPTYAMKLGSAVGDLILDEYERKSEERIEGRQLVMVSPHNNRLRATLDGFIRARNVVAESKFCSAFFDKDEIFNCYYPQVALQMHCTDADSGLLIVGQGTNDPFSIECMRCSSYEKVLLERCEAMLESIDSLTPPVEIEAPVMVPPERWRTVDLETDTSPNWRDELLDHLTQYMASAPHVLLYEEASKRAKALVPDDVGKVLAPGHNITRNKKGSLVITQRKRK